MADHGEVEYATATGNDYAEHEETYEKFTKAAVVGTLFVVNIVVVLAIWGVQGHWVEALGIFVIAIAAAVVGLANGSNIAGLVSLVLGLLVLAFT
jgi:ATP/ADP translocase